MMRENPESSDCQFGSGTVSIFENIFSPPKTDLHVKHDDYGCTEEKRSQIFIYRVYRLCFNIFKLYECISKLALHKSQ